MKVGIFYISYEPSLDGQPLFYDGGSRVTIRVEVIDCGGLGVHPLQEALDMANPRPGESVMNAHYLTAEDAKKDLAGDTFR